jgi:hypothetical protein
MFTGISLAKYIQSKPIQPQIPFNIILLFCCIRQRNDWSDVSQMLSESGRVDPTSLLGRSEGMTMAMLCNFHRLQLIVFINNSSYTEAKEIKLAPLLWLNSGRLAPETATSTISFSARCSTVDIATTQNKYSFIPHSHAAQVITHLVSNNQNKSERYGEYLPPLQVSLSETKA